MANKGLKWAQLVAPLTAFGASAAGGVAPGETPLPTLSDELIQRARKMEALRLQLGRGLGDTFTAGPRGTAGPTRQSLIAQDYQVPMSPADLADIGTMKNVAKAGSREDPTASWSGTSGGAGAEMTGEGTSSNPSEAAGYGWGPLAMMMWALEKARTGGGRG